MCTYLLFPPTLQCLLGVFLQKQKVLLLKPSCKKDPSTDYKFLHFLASSLHRLILASLLLKPSSTFIKCLLPSLKLLLYNSSVIPLALWHCVDMKCPPSSPQLERCLILGSNSTDFIKFSLNSSSKIQHSFLSIHGIFNTFNMIFGMLNSESICIFASLTFLQGKFFLTWWEILNGQQISFIINLIRKWISSYFLPLCLPRNHYKSKHGGKGYSLPLEWCYNWGLHAWSRTWHPVVRAMIIIMSWK